MNNNEIYLLCSVVSALAALGGLIFVGLEHHQSNKVKRAEFLDDLINRMRGDSDIRGILYVFQYNGFVYNSDFHEDTELQRKVDKALLYLSYICYLRSRRIIKKREFAFFEIEISQTLRNRGVIDYLFNLYHFECRVACLDPNSRDGRKQFTFYYLLEYGRLLGLVEDGFFDPNNAGTGFYHKYLNF